MLNVGQERRQQRGVGHIGNAGLGLVQEMIERGRQSPKFPHNTFSCSQELVAPISETSWILHLAQQLCKASVTVGYNSYVLFYECSLKLSCR